MLTLQHLRTLRHVSILIGHHHQGASLKSLKFKKSLSLKFLSQSWCPTYHTTLNVTHT